MMSWTFKVEAKDGGRTNETAGLNILIQLLQAIPRLLPGECEELSWYMNNPIKTGLIVVNK